MTALSKRYDFVLLFDVQDGNPNGDPDGGNQPRLDPETMHGLVTDVCLKRKIRNYVNWKAGDDWEGAQEKGLGIYVNHRGIALNTIHKEAYTRQALPLNGEAKAKAKAKGKAKESAEAQDEGAEPDSVAQAQGKRENVEKAQAWVCRRFFDVRAFGAVMSTKDADCGQVRGPVQITFGRSVSPIQPMEVGITRMAVTREEDLAKERTMGNKHIVPYGLYRAHGFISPGYAGRTGFSERDLELLWEALLRMFEVDHSAARGHMATRRLFVFEHDSALGEAPAHQLFDLVQIKPAQDVKVPRRFADYVVTAGAAPAGVKLTEKVTGAV